MATDRDKELAARFTGYVTDGGTAVTQEQIAARMRELKAAAEAAGLTVSEYLFRDPEERPGGG